MTANTSMRCLLGATAQHAQHVACLPSRQSVVFHLIVTKPAGIPPIAGGALQLYIAPVVLAAKPEDRLAVLIHILSFVLVLYPLRHRIRASDIEFSRTKSIAFRGSFRNVGRLEILIGNVDVQSILVAKSTFACERIPELEGRLQRAKGITIPVR